MIWGVVIGYAAGILYCVVVQEWFSYLDRKRDVQ